MYGRSFRWIVLPLVVLAAACGREGPAATDLAGPQFAKGANGGLTVCAADADWTVTDEAELVAALAGAMPGEVIGIEGMITVTAMAKVNTADVTITCASPGSGIRADASGSVAWPLQVLASDVSVSDLSLDGATAWRGALSVGVGADDVSIRSNEIVCGPGECIFATGASRLEVTDNRVTSHGSNSGIHIQGAGIDLTEFPTDETRVVGNTIRATAPSFFIVFAGVRVRDGRDMVVSDNRITGPWANGVAFANLYDSEFERNDVSGPWLTGVGNFFGGFGAPPASGNVIRNNQVSDADFAGIYVGFGCSNTYLGNGIARNETGAVFDGASGDNVLTGPKGLVVDNGALDCDDDGVNDPNVITGNIQVLTGVDLGDRISTAASETGGLY